ncbi:MAG: PAS domain S-box protein [Candidatus Magasanikbacteria bacterium]|nr:PAS domain S-box protein [Candidatus Magasanikbacteria bacterium]
MPVKKRSSKIVLPEIRKEVLEKLPFGAYVVDKKGKIEFFNRVMMKMAGTKRKKDVLGLNVLEIPTYKKAGLNKYIKAGLKGEPFFIEKIKYTSYTGNKTTHRNYHGIPIRNTKGEVEKLFLLVEDVTEKVELQKKLKKEKKEKEKILNTVPLAIAEVDAEGNLVYVNDTYEDMIGYKEKELLKSDVFIYQTSEKNIKELKKYIKKLIKEQPEPTPWFGKNKRKDGEVIDVRVDWSYRRDDEGKVIGFVTVTSDITEKKKRGKKLKESEEKYSKLVEESMDGILMLRGRKIIFVNRATENIIGYENSELVGKNFINYVAPVDKKNVMKNYALRMAGKKVPANYKLRLTTKSGKEITVEVSAKVIQYEGKKTDMVSVRDITEKNKLRRELKKSESLYRALFESIPDCLKLVDLNGKIIRINDGSISSHKYKSKKSVLGKLYLNTLPASIRKRAKEDFSAAKEGVNITSEYGYKDKSSNEKFYLKSFSPIKNKEGEVKNVLVVCKDISSVKLAAKEIEKSEKKIRSVFENLTSGLIIYKPQKNCSEFIIDDINKAGEKISKAKKKEVVGKKLQDVFPGVKNTEFIKKIKSVCKTTRPVHLQEFFYEDKRLSKWVENSFFSLPNGDIVALYNDITDRKKIEQKIKKSQRKYRNLFESAPDSIIIANTNGVIKDCNNSTEDLYGYSKDSMVGKKLSDFMTVSSLAKFERSFKTLNSLQSVEGLQIIDKNKKIVEIWRKTFPLKTESGKVGSILIFDRDVSDYVDIIQQMGKLNRELNEKMDELNKINKFMVGRELKMIELKEKIKKIQNKDNQNEK